VPVCRRLSHCLSDLHRAKRAGCSKECWGVLRLQVFHPANEGFAACVLVQDAALPDANAPASGDYAVGCASFKAAQIGLPGVVTEPWVFRRPVLCGIEVGREAVEGADGGRNCFEARIVLRPPMTTPIDGYDSASVRGSSVRRRGVVGRIGPIRRTRRSSRSGFT